MAVAGAEPAEPAGRAGPATPASGTLAGGPANAPPVPQGALPPPEPGYEVVVVSAADDERQHPALAFFPASQDEELRGERPTPWRYQRGAIVRIAEALDEGKHVILVGPTGSGKSRIGVCIARWFASRERNSYYSTPQIALQDQLQSPKEGFPQHLQILKGRRNYPCLIAPGATAEDAPCAISGKRRGHPCEHNNYGKDRDACDVCKAYPSHECHGCGYVIDRFAAVAAPTVNVNFSMLTHAGYLLRRDLLIVDECDTIESAVLNEVEVKLRSDAVGKPPGEAEPWEKHVEFLQESHRVLNAKAKRTLDGIANAQEAGLDVPRRDVRWWNHLDRLAGQVAFLLADWEKKKEEWVPTVKAITSREQGEGWEISYKPIVASRFLHQRIFHKGRQVLLMSATPPTPEELELKNVVVIEAPMTFPKANRPIFFRPVGKMGWKDREDNVGKLVDAILEVVEGKTIVHAHSYAFAALIADELRRREIPFVLQDLARAPGTREAALKRWQEGDDQIFISVNMERGLNLPDSTCRTIIIPVVPWPNQADKIAKARMQKYGDHWYKAATARTIMQATGRAVRHPKDWCHTYIFDSNFRILFYPSVHLFHEWWKEALHTPKPKPY